MKVTIMLDQAFVWYFEDPVQETPLIEISDELAAEFKEAADRYREVQAKIEQLYRVQNKMTPWKTPEVPEHTLLEDHHE